MRDVRSFRGAHCDTAHFVVVATVGGSVAVSKQAAHKCNQERINLRNPNELKVRRQKRIKISIGFAGFDN